MCDLGRAQGTGYVEVKRHRTNSKRLLLNCQVQHTAALPDDTEMKRVCTQQYFCRVMMYLGIHLIVCVVVGAQHRCRSFGVFSFLSVYRTVSPPVQLRSKNDPKKKS